MVYCYDCKEALPCDDDGCCTKCESQDGFTYTTEEIDQMYDDLAKAE